MPGCGLGPWGLPGLESGTGGDGRSNRPSVRPRRAPDTVFPVLTHLAAALEYRPVAGESGASMPCARTNPGYAALKIVGYLGSKGAGLQ